MKKIVLIEDNADVRETTQEILELADYNVLAAENGKVGVELVKQELPDLIICDIMMPELDGYGVIRILNKNPKTSKIPFIFLTAKADKTDIRKGMNLGADDYLTKPFEEVDLLDAVETRIERTSKLKNTDVSNIEGLNNFIEEVKGLNVLNNLSNDRKIKKFNKKEIIYREGDYVNYVYFINKGQVKCFKTDDYGKDFVNDIHGKGEFIGYMTLFEGNDYHESAIAMEETEVAIIPQEDFISLIRKNRDVAANFIKMLSNDIQEKERRLLQLAYASVRERVADSLLKLQDIKTDGDELADKFAISREDLANLIGTAKESLIRTLSELKKEGLVDTDGQSIKIIDRSGLERASIGH